MVKKLLYILLVPLMGFSQSDGFELIGELRLNDQFVASFKKNTSEKYVVSYLDVEKEGAAAVRNQQIEFLGKESVDDLYNSIVSGFREANSLDVEYRKQFLIFNTSQTGILDILNYEKKVQLSFKDREGNITKSAWMTKNQIDDLFGA